MYITLLTSIVIALIVVFAIVFMAMVTMQRARIQSMNNMKHQYEVMLHQNQAYHTMNETLKEQCNRLHRIMEAATALNEAGYWILQNPSIAFEQINGMTERQLWERLQLALLQSLDQPDANDARTPSSDKEDVQR